jgi:ATP synthase protein I
LIAILRIVAAQFGVGLLTVLAAFLTAGPLAAASALLGSLICAFPNAILGLRIAAAGATGDAKRMLRATYVAVALKLVLTAALFGAVFTLVRPLSAGWLFAGFIATQATMWAAPLLTGGHGGDGAGGAPVSG